MLHNHRKFTFRWRSPLKRGTSTITARTRAEALTVLARIHPGATLATRD